jgi:hypothetical protein
MERIDPHDRSGSIATGSVEQQVWACPLCLRKRTDIQSLADRDGSLRTCRTGREVLAEAC